MSAENDLQSTGPQTTSKTTVMIDTTEANATKAFDTGLA